MITIKLNYQTGTQTSTLTFLLKAKGIYLLLSEIKTQLTESELDTIFSCSTKQCDIMGSDHIPLHTLLACADQDSAVIKDVLRLLPYVCKQLVGQLEEWSMLGTPTGVQKA